MTLRFAGQLIRDIIREKKNTKNQKTIIEMRSLNKRLYDIWLVPKSKQQTSCALRDSLLSIDFDDLSDGGDKKHTTKKEAH